MSRAIKAVVMPGLLLVTACAAAPLPSWVDTDMDPTLSQAQYVTGAGCGETRDEARQRARAEIAHKLSISVNSTIRSNTEEFSIVSGKGYHAFVTRDSARTERSASDVSLAGVSYPRYYHGGGKVCVLAAVDKAKARTIYEGDMSRARSILRRYNTALSGKYGTLAELKAALTVLRAKEALYRDQKAMGLLTGTSGKYPAINAREVQKARNLVKQLATFQMAQTWGVDAAAQDRLDFITAEDFQQAGFTEAVINPAFIVSAQVEKHSSTFDPAFYGPIFHLHWAVRVSVYDSKTGELLFTKAQEGTTTGKELSTNSIFGTVSVYDKEEKAFSNLVVKPLLKEMFE